MKPRVHLYLAFGQGVLQSGCFLPFDLTEYAHDFIQKCSWAGGIAQSECLACTKPRFNPWHKNRGRGLKTVSCNLWWTTRCGRDKKNHQCKWQKCFSQSSQNTGLQSSLSPAETQGQHSRAEPSRKLWTCSADSSALKQGCNATAVVNFSLLCLSQGWTTARFSSLLLLLRFCFFASPTLYTFHLPNTTGYSNS